MKDKLAPALFCLLFAVAFGGVGVFAAWTIGGTLYDGMRAKEWVRAKAFVDAHGDGRVAYRYTVGGREYTGDRLGSSIIGGTDNIDSWHDDLDARLTAARAERKPITVFVNPDNPSESMVDREIRWSFLLFLIPFALAFGGVGVGALYALGHILFAGKKAGAPAAGKKSAKAAGEAGPAVLWIFAFFWNSISWPVAILVMQDVMREGNWAGILVMLFPLVGLVLLWTAIQSSLGGLRGGKLDLGTDNPRVGAPLQGSIVFPKHYPPGTLMRVRLNCTRIDDDGDSRSSRLQWHQQQDVRVVDVPQGSRVAFRFEVPAELPATSPEDTRVRHHWRLDVYPAKQVIAIPQTFEIAMQAAEEGAAFAPSIKPAEVATAPAFPGIDKILAGLGAEPLDAGQKAAFAALTSQQQAAVAKVAAWAPSGKKIVFAIIGIILVLEVLPALVGLIFDR